MICPHCSSPRHNLCAPGFQLEVEMTTLSDALNGLCSNFFQTRHSHLLGTETDCSSVAAGSGKVLVVVPVFEDTGLGDYAMALLGARAPQLLQGRKPGLIHFQGSYGQVHLLDFSCENDSESANLSVLFVGQGEKAGADKMHFCGLVGTGLDNSLTGHYSQLVIDIADFTDGAVDGRLIGAVARCRLATSIVEEKAEQTLRRMTLIAHDNQVEGLCHGISIAGPLCSSCSHPHAGWLNGSLR